MYLYWGSKSTWNFRNGNFIIRLLRSTVWSKQELERCIVSYSTWSNRGAFIRWRAVGVNVCVPLCTTRGWLPVYIESFHTLKLLHFNFSYRNPSNNCHYLFIHLHTYFTHTESFFNTLPHLHYLTFAPHFCHLFPS